MNTALCINKKGGEYNSGILVIVMLIYFSLFIVVVDAKNGIAAESGQLNLSDTYNIESGIFDDGYCSIPRYGYNGETGKRYEMSRSDTIHCEESQGVLGQSYCQDIPGCSWENVTSGWLWWSSSTETCSGKINVSEWNITKLDAFGNSIRTHDNVKQYDGKVSICNHPEVISNASRCDLVSCSWKTDSLNTINPTYGGISQTFKDVLTFSYDFGVENSTLSFFLNFIFVFVPLLLMIIGIYFLIPVIH